MMKINDNPDKKINDIVRRWLFALVIVAFILTIVFLGQLQTFQAKKNTDKVLAINIADVKQDILDTSDENLLNLANLIKYTYEHPDTLGAEDLAEFEGNELMKKFAELYDLTDVLIVGKDGKITYSCDESFIGFDMASGEQSAEFMCLLDGTDCYVQKYGPISYNSDVSRKFAGVALEGGGFLQVGYDGERFRRDIDDDVLGMTKNRHVGETGYILIISEEGDIVSAPFADDYAGNVTKYGFSLDLLESKMNDEPFEGVILGDVYNCLGSKCEGYYIFAVMPESEMLVTRNLTVVMISVLEAVIFVALFWEIYTLLRRLVINNIKEVTDDLDKIKDGDLDVVVDVRGNKEFDSLTEGINSTVSSLKQHIAAEAARIDAELEYAKNIQRSALPSIFPPYPDRGEFDIYATMTPAKEVGGDFFDFELMDGNRLGFCVADVSGKGIPAALFMMRAKTLIKSCGVAGMSADEILTYVNEELCKNNEAGMFVTCWLAILDVKTGRMTFSNAGHNPPLLCRSRGEYEYLRGKHGFILAGMEGMQYKSETIDLYAGDRLFLYTDGVTEATDPDNQLYGEDRLKNMLDSLGNCSAEETCNAVFDDITGFVGEAPQFDDITMLSLKFNGTGGGKMEKTFSATLDNYDEAMGFIETSLEAIGCPMPVMMKINVAADELFANVCSYAYGNDIGGITISIAPVDEPAGAKLTFTDSGMPFNPLDMPDPDTESSADERKIGGLGIYMVKKTMDDVTYEYKNGTNNLSIVKYF